jgi:hypothetical protein
LTACCCGPFPAMMVTSRDFAILCSFPHDDAAEDPYG